MGYRMGYIRALMGYGMVCEAAFQRVCLEEAALGGRAGLRAGSDGPGRGRAGLGSGRVGPGQASVELGWVKLRVGSGWVRGRVGSGSGRASSGRVGPGRVGVGPGSGGAGLRATKAPRGSKTSVP